MGQEDNTKPPNLEINTGGGTYVEGNVNVGKDFAGRDINHITNVYYPDQQKHWFNPFGTALAFLPVTIVNMLSGGWAQSTVTELRAKNRLNELELLYICATAGSFSRQLVEYIQGSKFTLATWNYVLALPFIYPIQLSDEGVFQLTRKARSSLLREAIAEGVFQDITRKCINYYENELRLYPFAVLLKANLVRHIFESDQAKDRKLARFKDLFTQAFEYYDIATCNALFKVAQKYMDSTNKQKTARTLQYLKEQTVVPVRVGNFLAKQSLEFTPLVLNRQFYYFAGRVLATYAQNSEAIERYKQGLEYMGEEQLDGLIHREMAQAYINLGNLAEAKIHLESAAQIIPKESIQWSALLLAWAIWHSKLDNWNEVAVLCQQIEANLPTLPVYLQAKYYHMTGLAYLYLGGPKTADYMSQRSGELSEEIGGGFDRVVGRRWRRMFAFELKGRIALAQNNLAAAEDYLQQAISNTPFELTLPFIKKAMYVASSSQVLLGRIYRMRHEQKKAIQQLEQAVQHPNTEKYWKTLAYLELGKAYTEHKKRINSLTKAYELATLHGFQGILYLACETLYDFTSDLHWRSEIDMLPINCRHEILYS